MIDMVRAGRAVVPELSPRWMTIGQSQGGHAALFTAHDATRYAPELDFRGAVTTGAPSNLETAFSIGGPWIPPLGLDGLTVFATYIFAGMRATMPQVDVDSYLTPRGKELVDAAETCCYDSSPRAVKACRWAVADQIARRNRDACAMTEYLGVPPPVTTADVHRAGLLEHRVTGTAVVQAQSPTCGWPASTPPT